MKENKQVNVTYWILWGAAVALYVAWPLRHLEAYAWSNDEGLYVQRAALANVGYPLYTETFLNKPPLLVWILQLAFRIAGQTLAVARLTSLCLTLLGFVALGAVVGQLWGRWAGLASAWVLLALPEVPVRAHVVMSDLPAMAFALVALGTALSFRRSRRRIWMALSGAAYAAALLIHPLLIYIMLPLAVSFFLPGLGRIVDRPARRTGWLDIVAFLGVAIGLGLLVLALVERDTFFTSVVRYNYQVTGTNVQLAAPDVNWNHVVEYLRERWALVWLAATAVAMLCMTPSGRRGLVVTASWFIATLVTLLAWSPIWKHYLLLLALPLVAVAGGGLATIGEWVIRESGDNLRLTRWRMVLVALMVVGAGAFAVERCGESMPQPEGGPEWTPDRLAARAFLETTVTPGGFVVTDDPLLAFAAGRLVPPALTGASYKRIRSGYLTVEDLVVSVLRYRAQAVLFATGRLAQLPAFEHWVAAVASKRYGFDSLWGYRLDLPSFAPHVAASHLGSGIELCGHALSSDELRPGDVLTVTLFWERDGSVAEDYTVFVHLVDEENHMSGQHDGPPLMGAYPTSRWTKGLLLPDPHALVISPETPPGKYRLLVGMYHWPSLERLPAYRPDGERWLDDRIQLTKVHVIMSVRASNPSSPLSP
jgi:4-amino-4-deoxy-L-arabinose transferase-like glycosyltransferase